MQCRTHVAVLQGCQHNSKSDIYFYFNVNFNVFFKLIKCICWWVNSTYTSRYVITMQSVSEIALSL